MCIGVPMQVVSCEGLEATCIDSDAIQSKVDISLVGEQPSGTWLLVFLGAAREVMEASQAMHTIDALSAIQRVMQGSAQIDHLFADLIDREPPLPEHLREAAASSTTLKNGD